MTLSSGIILTACLVVCVCAVNWTKYIKIPTFDDRMCPADHVGFQTDARSAASCAVRCNGTPGCRGVVYLHDNGMCFGITADNAFDTSTPLPGAVFFKAILSASEATPVGDTMNAPFFQGPYENNVYWDHCWTSPPGTTITLTFPSIEIECGACRDPALDCPDPHQCPHDYITIDENNDGSYELPKLCSTHSDYVYTASSNYVCLIFQTDHSCVYGGFAAVATYA